MINIKSIVVASLLLSTGAMASNVAVVDSGVDLKHPELMNRAWVNIADPVNGIDDDNNGFTDDYHGWNFTDNTNVLINYNYQHLVDDQDIRDFMVMQEGLTSLDDLSKDQIQWIKDTLKRRPKFIEDVMAFGNYIHGTHVAGIASLNNDAKIMPIKLLPTDANDVAQEVSNSYIKKNARKKGFKAWVMEKLIRKIAEIMGDRDIVIGNYLKGQKVDVMNGSYGTGFPQAQQVAKTLLDKISLVFKPKEKDINKVAKAMQEQLIKNAGKYVATAPRTLFVFAAGNDGLDNDKFLNSPSNVRADNSISVAATEGFEKLAGFSNYGKTTVDVAAPGVKIESTIPGGGTYEVSGTSQASPFVANVAARIKDENSSLLPVQIKKILMGTVTKKNFLKGKVVSGGIVNVERAVYAAKLSKTLGVDKAILTANAKNFPLSLL